MAFCGVMRSSARAGDTDDGELVGVRILDDGEDAAAGVEVGGLVEEAVVASAAGRSLAGTAGVVDVLAAGSGVELCSRRHGL